MVYITMKAKSIFNYFITCILISYSYGKCALTSYSHQENEYRNINELEHLLHERKILKKATWI